MKINSYSSPKGSLALVVIRLETVTGPDYSNWPDTRTWQTLLDLLGKRSQVIVWSISKLPGGYTRTVGLVRGRLSVSMVKRFGPALQVVERKDKYAK
jgi:hypothetical protein